MPQATGITRLRRIRCAMMCDLSSGFSWRACSMGQTGPHLGFKINEAREGSHQTTKCEESRPFLARKIPARKIRAGNPPTASCLNGNDRARVKCRIVPEIITLIAAKKVGRQNRVALLSLDPPADAMQSGGAEPRIEFVGIKLHILKVVLEWLFADEVVDGFDRFRRRCRQRLVAQQHQTAGVLAEIGFLDGVERKPDHAIAARYAFGAAIYGAAGVEIEDLRHL